MRKPSPALLIAIVALFVALGGVGWAATGGNFILGKPNTANATSYLTAPVAGGNALNVSNLNATAGSSALRLNVASGHPPFIVNSTTRVSGLNADKLDGIDSAGFVRGRGTFLANRLVFAPSNEKTLLTIPGLGYLVADCFSGITQVYWTNNTGGDVDAWQNAPGGEFTAIVVHPGVSIIAVGSANLQPGATLALGVGNDPSARRTAVLHVFAYQGGNDAPCSFQVQGTLWTSQ